MSWVDANQSLERALRPWRGSITISGTRVSAGWSATEILPVQPCSPSRIPWSETRTITVSSARPSAWSLSISTPSQRSVIVTSAA